MTQIIINKPTLTAEDLGEWLGLSEKTILNRRSTDPKSLPPSLNLDLQAPLWLSEDVLRWLRERSPYYVEPQLERRGPGRPRKQ